MSYNFQGKTIIITGGAAGLGKAAAEKLAAEGANLVLVDINNEALENTKKEILASFPNAEVLLIAADVSDEKAVADYVKQAVNKFQRIDGFFNNAGIEGRQARVVDYDVNIFRKVIDINLMGVYYGLKHVLAVMEKQGSGYIVNVASVGGIRGVQNQTPYVASKHAVTGMTKNAAIEYGAKGISVNAIAPGVILTDMVEGAFRQIGGENWEGAMADFVAPNPKKRCGKPSEVAELVAFLLSGSADYLNGAVIPIDGGQSSEY